MPAIGGHCRLLEMFSIANINVINNISKHLCYYLCKVISWSPCFNIPQDFVFVNPTIQKPGDRRKLFSQKYTLTARISLYLHKNNLIYYNYDAHYDRG